MQKPQKSGIYVLTQEQLLDEELEQIVADEGDKTDIEDKVRDTHEQSNKEPNKAPSGTAQTQSNGEARADHFNDDREGTEPTQREGSCQVQIP